MAFPYFADINDLFIGVHCCLVLPHSLKTATIHELFRYKSYPQAQQYVTLQRSRKILGAIKKDGLKYF